MADLCAVSHVLVMKIKKELESPPEKPQQKPVKLATVIEEDLEEPLLILPSGNDYVDEVVAENERLKDRLAVEVMDASEEEKTLAQETIESLRAEVKSLTVELEAVKRSRDQYQIEVNELKKQIKIYQRQLKK
jgi:septal ring factor EnvC (AmiA/AmiB activator)